MEECGGDHFRGALEMRANTSHLGHTAAKEVIVICASMVWCSETPCRSPLRSFTLAPFAHSGPDMKALAGLLNVADQLRAAHSPVAIVAGVCHSAVLYLMDHDGVGPHGSIIWSFIVLHCHSVLF